MDLYVILGVRPDASASDIKRAYRRLSRRYHPGINPGDLSAQEAFSRISEAYEVLMDPRRRHEYDAGERKPASAPAAGPRFTEFDFSARASGSEASTFTELFAEVLHPAPVESGRPRPGADLHASVTVPFAAQSTGAEGEVVVTRQVACTACRGSGRRITAEGRCPRCDGRGSTRWARGHMVFSKVCAGCGGTGRGRTDLCAACAGQGRAVRSDAVTVTIPAGVRDGARLRLAERGHAGSNGGAAGDLYVTVHVLPHPFFRREGDDLLCTIPVAVHEAVLGARIEVPTLTGRVRLTLPPGSQSGRRFRARGHGLPRAAGGDGDLIAEIRIVLPATVDERSKDLIREFGRLNQEDVRKDLTLAS
jgi:molecular chaperone DnaJ